MEEAKERDKKLIGSQAEYVRVKSKIYNESEVQKMKCINEVCKYLFPLFMIGLSIAIILIGVLAINLPEPYVNIP